MTYHHYQNSSVLLLPGKLKCGVLQGSSLDELLLSYPQSCFNSVLSNKYKKISNFIWVVVSIWLYPYLTKKLKTYFKTLSMFSLRKRNLREHNLRERQLRSHLWALYGFAISCPSPNSSNSASICSFFFFNLETVCTLELI